MLVYFSTPSRPSIFSSPMLLPCRKRRSLIVPVLVACLLVPLHWRAADYLRAFLPTNQSSLFDPHSEPLPFPPEKNESTIERHPHIENESVMPSSNNQTQQRFSSTMRPAVRDRDDNVLRKSTGTHQERNATTKTRVVPLYNISIVIQLSGELGNHLSKVAFGYAVQQLLLEKSRGAVQSHFVLQHQERSRGKWERTRSDLQQCFPFFRRLDFTLGNSAEFCNLQAKQQEIPNANSFVLPFLIPMKEVDEKLDYIVQQLPKLNTTTATIGNNRNISFPFLHTQDFAEFPLIDRYYDGLREMFEFDHDACCAELPFEDEAVFHFRNYLGELPRKGKQKGYEELSPNQTVGELFGHLPRGSKIAMTSRMVDHPLTKAYVDAFERRGWNWRVIENQTGVQDFCFLKSAKQDLAGMARSTFVRWAALLGNDNSRNKRRTTWLYSIDSNYTRDALGDEALIHYNWTYHPELLSDIRFVHYKAP